MRKIKASEITKAVRDLSITSNLELPADITNAIKAAELKETSKVCKGALNTILENIKVSKELELPICQDTGMAVVFIEIGQEVQVVDGDITEAINEGVRQGYLEGKLRCSIVRDPLIRENTNDNTPAIIHTTITSGDKIKITVAPKGFGSENMSAIKMFNPSQTKEDIIEFIVKTVQSAGSNPCPPIIVGVGIGGNFEHCAYLSKKALTKNIDEKNESEFYSQMESETLAEINKTGIGSQGFGGDITALAVNIISAPCHIAGLPVAVNICCHVLRHKTCEI